MKFQKIFLISTFLLLAFNCSDPESTDTTPPSVSIVSPQNNSVVSEIAIISCLATDNDEIDRIELWVNGISTGIFDKTEP